MANNMRQNVKHRRIRTPKIVLDAVELARLEALAEGAVQRNPALADRLFDEIGRARIVAPERMPRNVVSIGSIVTYRDETTGREMTVTLVYPEHADISRNRVSVLTPIGVALLGLAEGAAFHWDTRDGRTKMLTVLHAEPTTRRMTGS